MKVTLFLPKVITYLPHQLLINLVLHNPKQNTVFISFSTDSDIKKKKNQVILQISLPTTVLLVPLGCGNRDDPDEVVPGELNFLSAGGLN